MPSTVACKFPQEVYDFVKMRAHQLGYGGMATYMASFILKDMEEYYVKKSGQVANEKEPEKTAEQTVNEIVEEMGEIHAQHQTKMAVLKKMHDEIYGENEKKNNFCNSESELPTLRKLLLRKVWDCNGHKEWKHGKHVSLSSADVEIYVRLRQLLLRKEQVMKQIAEQPETTVMEEAPLLVQ